jgi:hypothetical protein
MSIIKSYLEHESLAFNTGECCIIIRVLTHTTVKRGA